MALTRPRVPGEPTPVETLVLGLHPGDLRSRSPRVVALRKRPRGSIDEPSSVAPASPAFGPADIRDDDRRTAGAHGRAVGMSSAAARSANVLPMPARRDAAQRQALESQDAADELAEDITEDVLGPEAVESDLLGLDEDEAEGSLPGPDAGARHRATRAAAASMGDSADDTTMAAWIARIARQDERALEALYDATAARVNGLVLRITQRAALAEEVLEDTYWQVWRQAPRFDAQRGRPITWLLAMARSRAIDALRREHRFQHDALPEDDSVEAADLSDARALPPQDLLEATRGHAHVHAALASLEPRSRQLVALAFFRGLTHEEIAAQQGLPLGTVKSLIRRALQQLKRVMEAEHA